ncbi:MAG: hypothetical protein KGL11_11060 [Alphaproteobacteria bacterium]|nr:hypothetical protein [Alphaproteobacteria bacterium]
MVSVIAAADAQTAKPQPDSGLERNINDRNAAFWADWKLTEKSPSFGALIRTVGSADKTSAMVQAAARTPTQAVVPIGINRPQDAAKVLDAASAPENNPEIKAALATVVTMRVSPETRKAAMPYVAPEAQQRVEAWNANLTTGIRGLPGIYLNWNGNAGSGGGESSVPSAPAGFEPIAGGSIGCPLQ